jgi:hypothetical protein
VVSLLWQSKQDRDEGDRDEGDRDEDESAHLLRVPKDGRTRQ